MHLLWPPEGVPGLDQSRAGATISVRSVASRDGEDGCGQNRSAGSASGREKPNGWGCSPRSMYSGGPVASRPGSCVPGGTDLLRVGAAFRACLGSIVSRHGARAAGGHGRAGALRERLSDSDRSQRDPWWMVSAVGGNGGGRGRPETGFNQSESMHSIVGLARERLRCGIWFAIADWIGHRSRPRPSDPASRSSCR